MNINILTNLNQPGFHEIAGVVKGSDILLISHLIQTYTDNDFLIVVESQNQLTELQRTLNYIISDWPVLTFPAWDCLPYDRISPRHDIQATRMTTLAHLVKPHRPPVLILTTVSAVLQKVRPRQTMVDTHIKCSVGDKIDVATFQKNLISLGFKNCATVYESGEFAVRGGIIDLFPPEQPNPLRIDLFGDEIENIKTFDPTTQRSLGVLTHFTLAPCQEVELTTQTIENFRLSYRQHFPQYIQLDPLYQAVVQGNKHIGIEHWLGYFYSHTETIMDYLKNPIIVLAPEFTQVAQRRSEHIIDYYQARIEALKLKNLYNDLYLPSSPETLYLSLAEFEQITKRYSIINLSHFSDTQASKSFAKPIIINTVVDKNSFKNMFEDFLKDGMHVHVACDKFSTVEKLTTMLRSDNFYKFQVCSSWKEGLTTSRKLIKLHHFHCSNSFQIFDTVILSDADLLQTPKLKLTKKSRRADLILSESSTLEPNSYVVHDDHGIAQFISLRTMMVNHIEHDCLELHFEGGDKLFLPIESLDLITRYGGEESQVKLDRLGSASWQARKSKVKKRLEDIAHKLLEIAAARQLKKATVFHCSSDDYSHFIHQFPYVETDDQLQSIQDVMHDLTSGMPMDRLICGDVGFGKTEVALRAAYIVASQGKQVAILTPTTLLCRQHYKNFQTRFKDFPIKLAQLSRFVTAKETKEIKQGLAMGTIDIVIGTHAILSTDVQIKNLGLVIIDEEQHFGVKQKERLKELAHNVHLLTLTATPIPRTLQMSLNGVRDLSVITTPPVDRLAVRTFVMPFDPVIIKEAIQRELFRGGQIYYVCPYIKDLDTVYDQLIKILPSLRIVVAHGQLSSTKLEDVMDRFMSHQYDLLLSTNIIESGIDLSTVNTMFIHKADVFGLSQLYQLRGRVGRSKVRAYTYLLVPKNLMLTNIAQRRLEVMQSLDSLGAGFQLASHDMDIRGGGNLLGQEQSGNIREVGVELYQQMLNDTIENLRNKTTKSFTHKWVPEITINCPVLIPENYIKDLRLRMEFYRRLAGIESIQEKEDIIDELVDRFGKIPFEAENLIQVINLKILCRRSYVAKLDMGVKGIVISFYDNKVPYLEQLINFIEHHNGTLKLRPDQKLVSIRPASTTQDQFDHAVYILNHLVKLNCD